MRELIVKEYQKSSETFETAAEALKESILAMYPNAKEVADDHYSERYTHVFTNGLYIRQMKIYAGEIVIGKIHKFPNVSTLVSGVLMIASNQSKPQVITAGAQFVVSELTFNVVYALCDCVFTNVHRTSATTVEEAELELVVPDLQTLRALEQSKLLEQGDTL